MADLPLSVLTDDEKKLVQGLARVSQSESRRLGLLEKYRDAEQTVRHIGIAVPPELRDFEATVNVPGMAVREIVQRQALKAFVRTGDEQPDSALQEAWEYNNLDSQSILCHKDARTFGRAFVSVGTNPEEGEPPLITVEPARGMAVSVDRRRRVLKAALRTYEDEFSRERMATLYLPDSTLYLIRKGRGWTIDERDDHNFGRLPLVMFLNDPVAGKFEGRSAMSDVIPKVDAISRTLTNMQVASEAAAIPQNVIFGADEDDFLDENGDPIPAWEAYWTKLKAIANEKGHIGTLSPADLKNFTHMVDRFLVWCAIELGLPTRYAGMDTTNPASEGAVVADEFRLVKRVENTNLLDGDSWSWVMGLHQEFATGETPARNSIRALWHNPATPTYSQRVDGVLKLKSAGLVSRRGAWDEMGWSPERKKRELQYMAQEADDPVLARFDALLNTDNGQPA
ncbi:phage portal protein [Aestuariimicrobium sp. p3-SID1156]|uniref:phage portal protein n=1 Tax=Aestuariimicrobium sp. p3-SID1156 TaxID=2916038 RepID=UPI00223C3A98|nr:phage portal protein [Aestuariimicrobium sp. p3-SID1156]MCT1459877.1 phage portal protein [Aestuariimicrobium sp. p3-SID1156]